MHKCYKCGTEFEGKFCPECGSEYQTTKKCPKCGATLDGGVKFCNECGYAFVPTKQSSPFKQKLSAILAWLKKHMKIVVPVAMLLVVTIVMLSLIPTFILSSVNGTYYYCRYDGELDEDKYITLSTGKWKNSDGETGKYTVSGKKVTIVYRDKSMEELFGISAEQKTVAAVKNGVLAVIDDSSTVTYRTKSHKHKLGKAETVSEPTCTTEGIAAKSCACGFFESEKIPATGHTYGEAKILTEPTCTQEGVAERACACGSVKSEKIPTTKHILDNNICMKCGTLNTATFTLSIDGKSYYLDSIDKNVIGTIIIPAQYNGKLVTRIASSSFRDCTLLTSIAISYNVTSLGRSSFNNCTSLTSITIPNSVKDIGDNAFYGCTALTDFNFQGTKAEWNAITKGTNWNYNTGNYTIHCTDGDIEKA